MEEFIDQISHSCFSKYCYGPTGTIGPMAGKYWSINENGIVREIDKLFSEDIEFTKSWFQVRHECEFCKFQKPRSELNNCIELFYNSEDQKFILKSEPMYIFMPTYPNISLYKHEICFDCIEKARSYLEICQNEAWNLTPNNIKSSSIPKVLDNLIFEYANPHYFHNLNCKSCKKAN